MILHFFRNGGIVGDDLLLIQALDLAVDIILGNLSNQRHQRHNTDQVGDHHQTVEGVGNVPGQGRGQNSAEDDSANMDYSEFEAKAVKNSVRLMAAMIAEL